MTENHWKALCLFLKEEAKAKEITQAEIASKIGITQSNVNRTLSAKYCPNLHTFLKICWALDISLQLFDKNDPDNDFSVSFKKALEQVRLGSEKKDIQLE